MFKEFVKSNDGDSEQAIIELGELYKVFAVEECAEFIKEVTKAMRNKIRASAMAEEAAHVIISLLRYLEYNKIQYENTIVDNWTDIGGDIYNIVKLQEYIITDIKISSSELDVVISSIFKICVNYGISSEEILNKYKTTIYQIKTGTK